MLMTAAGYVAAIVCPAFRPRYALAAPSTTVMTRPRTTVPIVNSFISHVLRDERLVLVGHGLPPAREPVLPSHAIGARRSMGSERLPRQRISGSRARMTALRTSSIQVRRPETP